MIRGTKHKVSPEHREGDGVEGEKEVWEVNGENLLNGRSSKVLIKKKKDGGGEKKN